MIHFYWALGGRWGFDSSLPTNKKGDRLLNPRATDSFIVGIGLLGFTLFYLNTFGVNILSYPNWLASLIGWFIPAIFTLRAIGDFRYVGFFKKIEGTKFSRMDTKLFSPLCIFVGILGFIVVIFGDIN